MNRQTKTVARKGKARTVKESRKSKGKTNRGEKVQIEGSEGAPVEGRRVIISKSSRGRTEEKEWSYEDEARLYQLHEEMGNRWTCISKLFRGRTDNDIKNHLFSRYRLSVRRINKIISASPHLRVKELKMSIISKIISTCDSRFTPQNKVSASLLNLSLRLKKDLISFLYEHHTNELTEEVERLIRDLHYFNQSLGGSKRGSNETSSQTGPDQSETHVNAGSMKSEQDSQVDGFHNQHENEEEENMECKRFFKDDEPQQIPLTSFRIYLPECMPIQPESVEAQHQKSPILLGSDPFSQYEIQNILPPFLSFDQAYEYDKNESQQHNFYNFLDNNTV